MKIKLFSLIKGLTVLELLVTFLIIVLITVLAVPIFSYLYEYNRLKNVAERLYHDLIYAQSEAIKRQANVTVTFQSGNSWCYGITTASSCNCLVANNCGLGQVSYLSHSNTNLASTGIIGNTTFSSSRGVVSTPGTITLSTSGGVSISVVVNKLGFPKICSNDLSEYKSCT